MLFVVIQFITNSCSFTLATVIIYELIYKVNPRKYAIHNHEYHCFFYYHDSIIFDTYSLIMVTPLIR